MTDDQSIVIKPREFSADLVLPENKDELAEFMDQPMTAIAEAIMAHLPGVRRLGL